MVMASLMMLPADETSDGEQVLAVSLHFSLPCLTCYRPLFSQAGPKLRLLNPSTTKKMCNVLQCQLEGLVHNDWVLILSCLSS